MKNWSAIAAASGLDIPPAESDANRQAARTALEETFRPLAKSLTLRAMSPPSLRRDGGRRVTIREAAAALRRAAVSSVELTTAALERIQRLDPKLNSFLTVTAGPGARARPRGR